MFSECLVYFEPVVRSERAEIVRVLTSRRSYPVQYIVVLTSRESKMRD